MNAEVALREQLYWAIRMRIVVIVVLIGNYLLDVPFGEILTRGMLVAAAGVIGLAANGIWVILIRKETLPLRSIAYYQCVFDLLVVSIIVYQHGAKGISGFLFVFVILLAGILLKKRGILLISGASIGLYFLFLLLETFGKIQPLPPVQRDVSLLPPGAEFLVDFAIMGFFFFLIGYACSHMQELLSKMTKESEFLADFNSQVIEMVPIGVFVLDAVHNVVVFNSAMERITMKSREEVTGKDWETVFEGIDGGWITALEKVEESREEVRLLGADLPIKSGKTINVSARLQPLIVKDQVLASVCTIQASAR